MIIFSVEVSDPSDMFVTPVEINNTSEGLRWYVDEVFSTRETGKRRISWAIAGDWRDLAGSYEIILPQRHGRKTTITMSIPPVNIIQIMKALAQDTNQEASHFIVYDKKNVFIGIYEETEFTIIPQNEHHFYRYFFSPAFRVALIEGPFEPHKMSEPEE